MSTEEASYRFEFRARWWRALVRSCEGTERGKRLDPDIEAAYPARPYYMRRPRTRMLSASERRVRPAPASTPSASLMHRRAALLAIALLTAAPLAAQRTPDVPVSGQALITRMHDAYAGKWFRTLTFEQKSTLRGPDGQERIETWYEATRAPGDLRIDLASPTSGNGMMWRGDSSYRFRGGQLVRAGTDANSLIPFVIALYHQPVEVTLRQLAPVKFDYARVRADTWEGRPAFVVGARDAADTLSPQFWVDAERLVLVRLIETMPRDTTQRLEVRMSRYEPLAGGWIAPYVEIFVGGRLVQKEEYFDMRPNVELSPDLFEPAKWTTAPHWKTLP